ncbi:MAG: hypothetical protein IPL40_13360 [Proteobacteria bacterium]|nr:hypothetical protein [Pseudomonadota bacterium]
MSSAAGGHAEGSAGAGSVTSGASTVLFSPEEIQLEERMGAALGVLLGSGASDAGAGAPARAAALAAREAWSGPSGESWRSDREPAALTALAVLAARDHGAMSGGLADATSPRPTDTPLAQAADAPSDPPQAGAMGSSWSNAELLELGPLTMVSTGEVLPEAVQFAPEFAGALAGVEDELEVPEGWRVEPTPLADELTVAEIERLSLPSGREPSAPPSTAAWSWLLDVLPGEARVAPTPQLAADLQLLAAHAARQLGESSTAVELFREAGVQHARDAGALVGLWCESLRQHDLPAAAEVLSALALTTRVRDRAAVALLRAELLLAAGAPLAELAQALPDGGDGWDQRLLALDVAAAGGALQPLIEALKAVLLGTRAESEVRASLALIVGRLHEASGDLGAAALAYDQAARGVTAAAAALGALRVALRGGQQARADALRERVAGLTGSAPLGASGEAAAVRGPRAEGDDALTLERAIELAWAAGGGAGVRELTLQQARRTRAFGERAQLFADAAWAAETLEGDGATAAALYDEALQSDSSHAGARRGLQRLAAQHPTATRAAAALDGFAATETGARAAALHLHAAGLLETLPGQGIAATQRLAAAIVGDPGCRMAASWLRRHGQSGGQHERIATALETAAESAPEREDAARLWLATAEVYDGPLALPAQALRCYQRAARDRGEERATGAAAVRLLRVGVAPSSLAQPAPTVSERVASWEASAAPSLAVGGWAGLPRALVEASHGDWSHFASYLRRVSAARDGACGWDAQAQTLRLAALLERSFDDLGAAASVYARLAEDPALGRAGLAGWWRCCAAAAGPAVLPPSTLGRLLAQLGVDAAPGLVLLAFDPRLAAVPEARAALASRLLQAGPWAAVWCERGRSALDGVGDSAADTSAGLRAAERVALAAPEAARSAVGKRDHDRLRALGREAQRVAGEDAAAYWLVFGGMLARDRRASRDRSARVAGDGVGKEGGLVALPTAQSAFGRVIAVSGSWGMQNALLQLLAAAWSARDRQRVAALCQEWSRLSADPRELAAGALLADLVRAPAEGAGGPPQPSERALFLGHVYQQRQAALNAGRWAEAFEAVQAELRLARVPEHRHAAHWLAAELAACQLARPAEAVAHLSRLTDLEPDDPAAKDCLTQVLVAAGQWAELVQAVESWIAREPSADRRLAWHRLVFRVAREQLRDLPRAERHARFALELCPHDGDALWALADLCEQQQRWPEAAAAVATAAELERSRGGRIALLVRLGELTLQRLGNPQRAALAYEEAVRLDPTHREAIRGLAQCARQRGQLEAALDLTAQLVDSEADLRQGLRELLQMARHCEENGAEVTRAGKLLQRAVGLAPADLEALEALVSFGRRWPQQADPSLYLDRALKLMRSRLAVDAAEPFALHAIFRICAWLELPDGCWCAAQALSALGQADRDEGAFLREHPGEGGAPTSRAIFEDEAQTLLLPTGLPRALLEVLAALRQPISRLVASGVAEHGLSLRDRLTDVRHPWRVAADRLAREWGVETFELYVVGHRPRLLALDPGDPPAVLVGSAWLQDATPAEMAFIVGRALWGLRHALTPLDKLSDLKLRQLLLAILQLHGVNGAAIGPIDREVERWSARLGRWVSRRLRERLLPQVLECAGGGLDVLALRDLAEAGANRAGLLACRSLVAAVSVLRRLDGDPIASPAASAARSEGRAEIFADLLRFAQSEEHLLLRRRLGLALRGGDDGPSGLRDGRR